jgi:hypothetical protein
VLNVGYSGAKGTRLDVISAPGFYNNVGFASAFFNFEDSAAFSNFNALIVRANKRLLSGLALQATYAYSHSIDNASSINAGAPVGPRIGRTFAPRKVIPASTYATRLPAASSTSSPLGGTSLI